MPPDRGGGAVLAVEREVSRFPVRVGERASYWRVGVNDSG